MLDTHNYDFFFLAILTYFPQSCEFMTVNQPMSVETCFRHGTIINKPKTGHHSSSFSRNCEFISQFWTFSSELPVHILQFELYNSKMFIYLKSERKNSKIPNFFLQLRVSQI